MGQVALNFAVKKADGCAGVSAVGLIETKNDFLTVLTHFDSGDRNVAMRHRDAAELSGQFSLVEGLHDRRGGILKLLCHSFGFAEACKGRDAIVEEMLTLLLELTELVACAVVIGKKRATEDGQGKLVILGIKAVL